MTGNLAEDLTGRRAAVVSCWLCGVRLNSNQMVPDGSDACDDIRWYCEDTRACTERWTSDRRRARAAGATSPGSRYRSVLSRRRHSRTTAG